jgi:large subunit ribosomal protein L9
VHAASAAPELGYQAGAQYRAVAVCRTSDVKLGHGFTRIGTDFLFYDLVIRDNPRKSVVDLEFYREPLTTGHWKLTTGVNMEVILKEDVVKLGSRGDVVKVAEGYGRNFLLPRKLAIEATAGNKKVIEQMRAAAVRRSAKEKAQAEELSKQFDGLSVSFQRRSGEHDQLFGSVTSGDIADALQHKGFNVDRRKIQVHEALKTLGEFTIPVKLHKDVTAHLKVVIEKEAAAQ